MLLSAVIIWCAECFHGTVGQRLCVYSPSTTRRWMFTGRHWYSVLLTSSSSCGYPSISSLSATLSLYHTVCSTATSLVVSLSYCQPYSNDILIHVIFIAVEWFFLKPKWYSAAFRESVELCSRDSGVVVKELDSAVVLLWLLATFSQMTSFSFCESLCERHQRRNYKAKVNWINRLDTNSLWAPLIKASM